jgi:hypothetical protein
MKRQLVIAMLVTTTAMLLAGAVLVSRGTIVRSLARDPTDPMADMPRVILWAWERPERLRFINPREVGVAFLAQTLYLRNDDVVVKPRSQPLDVPPETRLIMVVRIESNRLAHPSLSSEQISGVVSAIMRLPLTGAISALQIDFDARESEREFYRALLLELRRQLNPAVRLSITALASWCLSDRWMQNLGIDEAVPMLFRMGVDSRSIRRDLETGGHFAPGECAHSVGISTDEPITDLPHLPAMRRFYVFHPKPWSEESVRKILEEVKQWQ